MNKQKPSISRIVTVIAAALLFIALTATTSQGQTVTTLDMFTGNTAGVYGDLLVSLLPDGTLQPVPADTPNVTGQGTTLATSNAVNYYLIHNTWNNHPNPATAGLPDNGRLTSRSYGPLQFTYGASSGNTNAAAVMQDSTYAFDLVPAQQAKYSILAFATWLPYGQKTADIVLTYGDSSQTTVSGFVFGSGNATQETLQSGLDRWDGGLAPDSSELYIGGANNSLYLYSLSIDSTKTLQSISITAAGEVEIFDIFAVFYATIPAPVIDGNPSNATAYFPGGMANFSVLAHGPDLQYQWTKNGAIIADATVSAFSFAPVLADNNAQIAVKVSNGGGSVTSSPPAVLTVIQMAWTGHGVSVNFRGGGPALQPTDAAGVLPLTDWNNSPAGSGTFTLYPLFDSTGNPTPISLTSGFPDNYNSGGPQGTADENMMYGIVKTWPNGNSTGILSLSNLVAGSYDLYLYFDINQTLSCTATFSVGDTTDYVGIPLGTSFTGIYMQCAPSADPNSPSYGNYLVFPSVSPDANGAITITAQQVSGAAALAGLQLVVAGTTVAPTITAPPTDQTAYYPPGTATFVVGASGPGLQYQWKKNGTSILNATNQQLIYSAAPADNGATFAVVVYNSGGTNTSAGAKLTVVPTVWQGNPLSINFVGRNADALYPLAPTDVAGVIPVANWNNVGDGNVTAGAQFPLFDSVGNPTPVTLTYNAQDAWHSGATSDANHKMMYGFIKFDANGGDITLTNVPDGNYNVYVYSQSDNSRYVNLSIGGTTYYLGPSETDFPGTFTQCSNTDGTYAPGNYVEFTGVQPVDGAITIIGAIGNGATDANAGVAGVQLVPAVWQPPLTLSIVNNNGSVVITYTGVLESCATVNGTCTDVTGASGGSYTVPMGATPMKFYRARSN